MNNNLPIWNLSDLYEGFESIEIKSDFDYISRGVTDGIMRLTLSTDIPIIFGVLTVYNYEQALNRVSLEGKNKGSEIIQAGLLAIETYNKINS